MKVKSIIALILISIIAFFFTTKEDKVEKMVEEKKAEISQSVQVNGVNKINYVNEINLFARLKSDNLISINSQVKETIKKINFNIGDKVERGDIIAELDMGNLESHLNYLNQNKKELQIEKNGLLKLSKNNQVSKLDLAKIETKISKIESDIISTKNNINKRKIIATQNGVIDELPFKAGEIAETSMSFVTIIGDINKVESQIHASDLNSISLGQEIVFHSINESIKGIISHISRNVSNKNNTVKIEATLNKVANFNQLNGEISIQTDTLQAMKIPASSIVLADGNTMGIFHVKNNIAKLETIEIIKNDGNFVWIKPITDKINLVTVGQFYLKDNMNVVIGENIL